MNMHAAETRAVTPYVEILHRKRRAAGDAARDALKAHAMALATAVHREDATDPFRDQNLAGRLLLAAFCEVAHDRTLAALVDALGDLANTDAFDYRACADAHGRVSDAALQLYDEHEAARSVAEDRA